MAPGITLHEKRALITGGGTGIGLAIARAFIDSGARVIITGRRVAVLEETCAQLGPAASWRCADVSVSQEQPALVAGIEREFGPIDILVNNAGANLKKPALEVTDEEFAHILQTNVNGLFALTREVARGMAGRGRGAILNIASMSAMYGLPKLPAYSAAKSAVLGLTRSLACEFGPMGIRVNAIAPGFIYSEMSARALDADPDRKARVLARTPLGRMGTPEEIGWGAVYLCSDAASFVTGANLCIDGGNSIGF